MTIQDIFKTEIYPMYFTFEELCCLEECMDAATDYWEQPEHRTVTDLVEAKVEEITLERDREEQERLRDSEQKLRAAFDYNYSNYTSPHDRTQLRRLAS